MFNEEDFDIISVNDLLEEQKNNKVINIMETLEEEEKEFDDDDEEEKRIEEEEEKDEKVSSEILLECEKNFDALSTTTVFSEVSEMSEKSTQTIREKIDEILDKSIKDFSDIGTMTDIIFDDDVDDDVDDTGDISDFKITKTIELVSVEGKEEPEIVINEEKNNRFKRRSCFSRFFYKILNWWFILKFKLFSIFRN